MKKGIAYGCMALLVIVATTALPAFGDEVNPAVNAASVKKALGMSLYVQGGYTYNAHASDGATVKSSENDLRWLDHRANSFGVDLVELVFQKDPDLGTTGYKLKLSAGETASLIHSAGLGDAGQDAYDVTEAYVSYTAKVGSGLRFDLGKMGTFIGAEVMEAEDDPNYSRSFLFNYAEPLTHTGLKIGYNFTDAFNAAVFILNGWDNVADNNTGKTFGLSLGLTPASAFSASINMIQGPEQTNNTSNQRSLLDLVATITPLDKLSVILNYDDGKEQKALGTADAKWSGVSGIVKYDLSDAMGIAVRAESFDDTDGYRTGTVQKLTEVTVTPEFRLDGGLVVRPEYRHDTSDKASFDNGTKKSQDTLALGVMYRW